MSVVAPEVAEAVLAAATAAAGRLPSAAPLTAGTPVVLDVATIARMLPNDVAAAVQANFTGSARGMHVVFVGEELVVALKTSPLGALELAPAVQPCLAAAGAAYGQVVVETGVELTVEAAVTALGAGASPTVVVVPLMADGDISAAYAVSVTLPTVPRPRGTADGSLAGGLGRKAGLELLHDVEMEVTAELGRTRMTVRDLLSLAPGAVVELDRAAGSPCDLLVNGTLIARGEVVVVDEDFGIRITEIISPAVEGGPA